MYVSVGLYLVDDNDLHQCAETRIYLFLYDACSQVV